MNDLFKKIHFFLVIGLCLSLPFSLEHVKVTSFFIIVITANAIPFCLSSKPAFTPSQTPIMIMFVSVFLINVYSAFTTSHVTETLFGLEKKLAILLFPLVFYFTPRLSTKQVRLVLLSFVLACMNACIYSLAVASVHYVCWNDAAYFSYRILSSTLGMHAIYLSMYLCFAVAVLFFLFHEKLTNFSFRDACLFAFSLIILVGTTILLAGRIAILILIVEIMVYVLIQLKRNNSTGMAVLKSGLMGLLIFSLALLPAKNRSRLKEAINYKGQYSVDKKDISGALVRPYIWSCAGALIREKPVFGWGIGDTELELTQCYAKRHYTFLTEADNDMKFNAHNQYLELAIGAGIIGLIIYLLSLMVSVREAFKVKNYVFLTFIGIFLISCLTESMLERQSGIVFYAFFNAFLFFNPLRNEDLPMV